MSELQVKIEASWHEVLTNEFSQPYFQELKTFLNQEKQSFKIFPPGNQIFSAFNYTPVSEVKVVILGQDPYHGEGQANGLCFSVSDGIKPPPSLVNIFKELNTDLGIPIPIHGNLEKWAKQGVFLLNTTLTVRQGQPASHHGHGWEIFTDEVIRVLTQKRDGLVFLLWGRFAQSKESLIDSSHHHILKAAHPSPFSATGFLGCRHFSKTNALLIAGGKSPIDWNLNHI